MLIALRNKADAVEGSLSEFSESTQNSEGI